MFPVHCILLRSCGSGSGRICSRFNAYCRDHAASNPAGFFPGILNSASVCGSGSYVSGILHTAAVLRFRILCSRYTAYCRGLAAPDPAGFVPGILQTAAVMRLRIRPILFLVYLILPRSAAPDPMLPVYCILPPSCGSGSYVPGTLLHTPAVLRLRILCSRYTSAYCRGLRIRILCCRYTAYCRRLAAPDPMFPV